MAKSYGLAPDGTEADVKRNDLPRFPPEVLLPMKNYRFGSFDTDPEVKAAREAEIELMVESLLTEGQKQPIIIHEVTGKRFCVHAGDTRHQAFLRIVQRGVAWPWEKDHVPRIECRVENFAKEAEKQVFGSSIVENLARANLTVIDICIAVAEAERLGYTDTEIMAKFRQTDPAFLPNMRRLARLPDPLKRQIHLKQMAPSVGYLLAEIPEDAHAAVLAEAAGEINHPADDPAWIRMRRSPVNDKAFADVVAEYESNRVDNHIDGDPHNNALSNVSIETLPNCPDCGDHSPNPDNPKICIHCDQPFNFEDQAAPPESRSLDYSESQTPAGKTSKPLKPKKITARAVATAAKKRGLLGHKKIGKTVAELKEFWSPFAEDRNAGTKIHKLAEATLAHLGGESTDDRFYEELLALFKEKHK